MMKRFNSGLLLSALALGTAAVFGAAPVEARPAIVERLAELNTRGTEKDHGGLAFSTRTLSESVRPSTGLLTASGDSFSPTADNTTTVGRPAIVQTLAELNARGTEKDHGGLAFSSRTLSNDVERSGAVLSASGDSFRAAVNEVNSRPAIVQRLAEINARGTEKDHGGLSFNTRTLSGN
ncbi:MAG: hypothetical protein AAFY57_11355 [Cyanobacteria bacterium J06642_2]